jgi:3',5'-cyclic-AMP phosphodiesterase
MLIAQISDFHLKPRGELAYAVADTEAPLRRAVDHINRLNPSPDVVLVTGDLSDGGEDESYSFLRELLSSLKPPCFFVPGNHDRKQGLRRAFPEHAYLSRPVRAEGRDYLCYALEDFPLRLIGLDTVTPGEHGGGFDGNRMIWLEKTLSARRDAPTVLFMHHPPFACAIGHMDKEVFRGWQAFETLIANHPQVERVLCGHLHRPVFRRFGGTIASACPALGMQLCLDLREEAPSAFKMEPPSVMLHLWTCLWGQETLLSHLDIIEDRPGQYGGPHPFFGVVSPK